MRIVFTCLLLWSNPSKKNSSSWRHMSTLSTQITHNSTVCSIVYSIPHNDNESIKAHIIGSLWGNQPGTNGFDLYEAEIWVVLSFVDGLSYVWHWANNQTNADLFRIRQHKYYSTEMLSCPLHRFSFTKTQLTDCYQDSRHHVRCRYKFVKFSIIGNNGIWTFGRPCGVSSFIYLILKWKWY